MEIYRDISEDYISTANDREIYGKGYIKIATGEGRSRWSMNQGRARCKGKVQVGM